MSSILLNHQLTAPHYAPSSVGSGGGELDRELEAAKERLRKIQLERNVLTKQARCQHGEYQPEIVC